MSGINKVILVGRLGRDPETQTTATETVITKFSLATSDVWNDSNSGERVERTEWHRIVAWNKLAEIAKKYLSKGSQVYVEGKLKTRSWEDNGVTKYMTEVVANQLQFLGGSGSNNREDKIDGPFEPITPSSEYNQDDVPF